MAKYALTIFVKLIFITTLSAQLFTGLNVAPSVGFTQNKILGQPFIGYKPNRFDLELAGSLSLGYKFKYCSINLGINYYLNSNKTKYYSSNSDNRVLLNTNSINLNYFEPIIGIEAPVIKGNKYLISLGIGLAYQIQSATPFSFQSTISLPESTNLGNIMTVQTTLKGTNLNSIERLKYIPRLSYNYVTENKTTLSIGVLFRISSNEVDVWRKVYFNYSNYEFSYNLNSSSIGLAFGITRFLK